MMPRLNQLESCRAIHRLRTGAGQYRKLFAEALHSLAKTPIVRIGRKNLSIELDGMSLGGR